MTILSQTKYFLLPMTVFILGAPQMAFAQSSSPFSGLYACEQVEGDAAQLACFRAETAKIRASESFDGASSLQEERLAIEQEKQQLATERARITAEKEKLTEAKKPAFNKNFDTRPKGPKSQTVAITKAETLRGSGYIRFTLANGEVWQQTESGRVRLGRASPDLLVITKGRVGGYFGKVNDRRPSFRVKRVK